MPKAAPMSTSTPTLGYEADTQISKDEIGQVQLTEAIALFIEKKFLSALTLAGAAEEIFGRLLNSRGEKAVVEQSFVEIQKLRDAADFAVMDHKSKNELFQHWNTARNTVKHHNKTENEMVTINLFDEGYWMIKRALANASRLDINIDNELDFENWCIQQIHI
jgi:hypothetical protein